AAEEGCAEVVKFLVEKGVDINATKYERWTPLHDITMEDTIFSKAEKSFTSLQQHQVNVDHFFQHSGNCA
ncbi:MAG: ankyrin repeat domain-containing protein, partial [Wolbachia sp.]